MVRLGVKVSSPTTQSSKYFPGISVSFIRSFGLCCKVEDGVSSGDYRVESIGKIGPWSSGHGVLVT
jgi:hypothetical protein